MTDNIPAWSWISLILLGSFHGINPAMGWLFAVALGIQRRSSRALTDALGSILIGHALSVGMVVAAVWVLGEFLPEELTLLFGGGVMLTFAGWKIASRFRHKVRFGMRVNSRELIAWSFVMATAHGAGLMLVPPILAMRSNSVQQVAASGHNHAEHLQAVAGESDNGVLLALAAVGLHMLAMFVVTSAVAFSVYRWIGVDVLRKAWVNIDRVWIGTLALAGAITLGLGVWSLATG